MQGLILSIVLAPLLGAVAAAVGGRAWGGFWGPAFAKIYAHTAAIGSVGLSFVLSAVVAWRVIGGDVVVNFDWYVWAEVGGVKIAVGFLVDNLTAVMMLVVTFVSLMVHIYTIGYMAHDDGYCRFFSYIALFTFAMLMLVMANNFMQLFFGWEAVGLVSYLLIGFWYTRKTAIAANLKAFLVNRVGDLGFLLGIGLVLAVFGSLSYADVFGGIAGADWAAAPLPGGWDAPTVICLLLFVGAMGKSAQVPLHVWLPDSMEGPTPISALIHAATMVTAGIFMVARMSPLFELSEVALLAVLIIGTITAFFTGLLGLVQNDIKRVVAYSTLSQLGYMTAALGASAYSAAIFHLFTHAFFKALLFLAAGSVIIALHHQQDMRKMGGLWRKMPVTYGTALLGTLALVGFPPFSGFFSKDAIIEAVAVVPGTVAHIAHIALLIGAFVTALYSVRLLILVFHGEARYTEDAAHPVKESPWVVTAPLVLLAVPSVFAGGLFIAPMLFADFFAGAIFVLPEHNTVAAVAEHAEGRAVVMLLHGATNPALWAGVGGIALALWLYAGYPRRTEAFARGPIFNLLQNKYWFDEFNNFVFAGGARRLAAGLWRGVDVAVVDGFFVNGAAAMVAAAARVVRRLQSGAIYQYAFFMLFAVAMFLLWRLGGGGGGGGGE